MGWLVVLLVHANEMCGVIDLGCVRAFARKYSLGIGEEFVRSTTVKARRPFEKCVISSLS